MDWQTLTSTQGAVQQSVEVDSPTQLNAQRNKPWTDVPYPQLKRPRNKAWIEGP